MKKKLTIAHFEKVLKKCLAEIDYNIKSHLIDRAIEAIEVFQLPAPKFIKGEDYTRIIMYSLIPLRDMNKEDRVRACYQHTCLHHVSNQLVNNQSIRKRFNIAKNNTSYATKILTETMESGLIKASDPDNASKKYATYVPYWA